MANSTNSTFYTNLFEKIAPIQTHLDIAVKGQKGIISASLFTSAAHEDIIAFGRR